MLYGDEVFERIESGLSDSTPEQRKAILWDNPQQLAKVADPTPAESERQARTTRTKVST